jgi:hypothetical protein
MKLNRNKIIIPNKPYITEKLDSNTVSKMLDSSFFVVDGIYKIKQGAKTNIELFKDKEITGYKINAYVKVNYAYAGKARAQVSNITTWRKLIRNKPSYELRVNVYGPDHLAVHHFSCKYTNVDVLHEDIEIQTRLLEEVLFQLMKQN